MVVSRVCGKPMLEQLTNLSPITRRRMRLLSSVAAFIGLLVAAWHLLLILLPLVISGLTAYSLMPLVRAGERTSLARRWPGLSKLILAAAASALAVLIVLGIIAITVWALVDGVSTLTKTIPALVEEAREEWVKLERVYRERVPVTIQETIDPQVEQMYDSILDAATHALGRVASVVPSNIAQFITIIAAPATIFRMLHSPSALSNSSRKLVPGPLQEDLPEMVRIAGEVIVSYFRIQLLLGAIVGVVIFLAYSVLGIPMAMAFGLLGVLSELVPVIGSTIFIILTSILLALTDISKLPLALGVFVLVQVVQMTVVQPKLHARALGLSPTALVVAMAVFTLFFGLLGALVAAPLTGAAYHVLRYVGREWERSEHPADVSSEQDDG